MKLPVKPRLKEMSIRVLAVGILPLVGKGGEALAGFVGGQFGCGEGAFLLRPPSVWRRLVRLRNALQDF